MAALLVQLPVAGVAARGECHLVARDPRTALVRDKWTHRNIFILGTELAKPSLYLCGVFLKALVLEGEATLHPTRFTHRAGIAVGDIVGWEGTYKHCAQQPGVARVDQCLSGHFWSL